ncbi:hypothetical protein GUJ93_ZPchr0005g15182 [Zizania palustris]|uniref:Uncharacterized protein n=1 Tax=Zizania palustris TaxID=103762 RepID=A0A8J5S3Z4_ZIZPA|nr:hypothetical protein GUJ93_ZPchr0005g15182 [Zizania palustris]
MSAAGAADGATDESVLVARCADAEAAGLLGVPAVAAVAGVAGRKARASSSGLARRGSRLRRAGHGAVELSPLSRRRRIHLVGARRRRPAVGTAGPCVRACVELGEA